MSGNEIDDRPDAVTEVAPVRRSPGTLRRRIGLGIAMSGVLAVAAGGVFIGVSNAQAAADDARSLEAVADAAASLDDLPPVEPVSPADPAATPDAGRMVRRHDRPGVHRDPADQRLGRGEYRDLGGAAADHREVHG